MNRTQSRAYAYSMPQTTIAALTALVVVSICLYGVLVFTIVHRVAYRERAQAEINEKSLAVGELEATYIAMKNNISEESIAGKGYTTVAVKSYVTNRSLGLSRLPLE